MTNPGGNIFDAPTHSTVGEEDYRHPANPASYRPGDPREPRPQPDYTAEPKNPEAQHLPVPHGVALHPNVIAPPATGPTKAPGAGVTTKVCHKREAPLGRKDHQGNLTGAQPQSKA
jgi:hypothetical protein